MAEAGWNILLPLREKVAREARRMRGLAGLRDAPRHSPTANTSTTPHPSASPTPSPARGEGRALVLALLAACLATPAFADVANVVPEPQAVSARSGPPVAIG